MKIKNLFAPFLFVTISVLLLCGCESDIQIFEDENAKYRAVSTANNDLKNDIYYVKEGTKFYETYDVDTAGGLGGDIDRGRCAYFLDSYKAKIPTYYFGELIAYASKNNTIDDIALERVYDTGYSIGVYGAKWEDGYITFTLQSNTVKNSDAAKKFKNNRSNYIMIETINGQNVTADMLNKAGVFVGFEENKDYNVTFYAGTYYGEVTIKADTHFFQSYEMYTITDHDITKNGYIAVRLPDDLKTGYYMIDKKGMFRYVAQEKGVDLTNLDYNEQYYTSDEEQLAAYSQQFTFTIETEKVNGSIVASFDKSFVNENTDISTFKMLVTSPDGERQMFEPDFSNGTFTANYTKMMPGRWIVNITPQSLDVDNVEVVDNAAEQEMTTNSYTFNIDEDKTGIEFYIDYEGEGEVNAQVIGPDGFSHDLERDNKSLGTMGYTYSYLEAGEYTINVYHYPDTKITEANYGINEKNKEEEIITIEG